MFCSGKVRPSFVHCHLKRLLSFFLFGCSFMNPYESILEKCESNIKHKDILLILICSIISIFDTKFSMNLFSYCLFKISYDYRSSSIISDSTHCLFELDSVTSFWCQVMTCFLHTWWLFIAIKLIFLSFDDIQYQIKMSNNMPVQTIIN